MAHQTINRQKDRLQRSLDSRGVLGSYSVSNTEFDIRLEHFSSQRPREEDFVDVYGREEIIADKLEIRKKEESENYQNERPEGSTLAEGVVAYGIEKRGWLGPKAKVYLTSKYDDVLRGVDMLVEVPHPDTTKEKPMSLGLAIDVTAANSKNRLAHKLMDSFQRLNYGNKSMGNPGGQMTVLKYLFKSYQGDSRLDKASRKYNHYVAPMNGKKAKELAEIFVKEKDGDEKTYEELEAQIQIIYSLRQQAFLQLGEVMDKYCGQREHALLEYQRLPEDDKDDFYFLFDWVFDHLPAIEKHLKEKWKRTGFNKKTNKKETVDENNAEMFVSIKKNLSAIRYLESLLTEIINNKKEAETVLDNFDRDGFSDPGTQEILSYDRYRIKKLITPPYRSHVGRA